jgi:hypothetical protein
VFVVIQECEDKRLLSSGVVPSRPICKVKVKVLPITDHEGPEGEV